MKSLLLAAALMGALKDRMVPVAIVRTDAVVEALKGKSDQVIITDEVVNVDVFSDADQLDVMLRKLDMSQPYGSFSKRREPVPTYPVGDTRQLVFGQTVKQTGPVIDTSKVTKRSKRRNRHK